MAVATTTTREELVEDLLGILQDKADLEDSQIDKLREDPTLDLEKKLGITSLQALRILRQVKKSFGVEISDDEAAELRTFALIQAKLEELLEITA